MIKIVSVLFILMLLSTNCFAGWWRQDASGNWLSSNSNGKTTYYTEGADGSWYSSD